MRKGKSALDRLSADVEGDIEALNNAEAAHKLKERKVIITKLVQAKKKKKKNKKNENF